MIMKTSRVLDKKVGKSLSQHLENDHKEWLKLGEYDLNCKKLCYSSVWLKVTLAVGFFVALQAVISATKLQSASVLALRETDAPAGTVVWLLILSLIRQQVRNRKWCISIKDLLSHTVALSSHLNHVLEVLGFAWFHVSVIATSCKSTSSQFVFLYQM